MAGCGEGVERSNIGGVEKDGVNYVEGELLLGLRLDERHGGCKMGSKLWGVSERNVGRAWGLTVGTLKFGGRLE